MFNSPLIVPIAIVFIVVGIPVICKTALKIAHVMSDKRNAGGSSNPEETRVMQELNRTLSRLESRIEALETIVVERETSRSKEPSL